MDEILYELREHSAGLNAGRWDYIFSVIKKLGHRPEFVLPDRSAVTMAVPFMFAYTELLVKTCHARGAHAMGGMAAFIPSRRDPEVNEVALAKVREDKEREAGQGFDGTWVAHPDLVPVAMEIFDRVLGDRPNQVERQRDDVSSTAADLLDVASTPGEITEAGLHNNVSVGIQYLAAWLHGSGAVAIFNLMEDAATSEISRSQVWQWLHHGEDRAHATSRMRSRRRSGSSATATTRRARSSSRSRWATSSSSSSRCPPTTASTSRDGLSQLVALVGQPGLVVQPVTAAPHREDFEVPRIEEPLRSPQSCRCRRARRSRPARTSSLPASRDRRTQRALGKDGR